MPRRLTFRSFGSHTDTPFTAYPDGRASAGVELTLVEATDKTPAGFPGEQFSLIFKGPPEPRLPQRTYPMGHAELGDLDLFLVPVGRQDSHNFYEAFFNLLGSAEE